VRKFELFNLCIQGWRTRSKESASARSGSASALFVSDFVQHKRVGAGPVFQRLGVTNLVLCIGPSCGIDEQTTPSTSTRMRSIQLRHQSRPEPGSTMLIRCCSKTTTSFCRRSYAALAPPDRLLSIRAPRLRLGFTIVARLFQKLVDQRLLPLLKREADDRYFACPLGVCL